MYNMMSAPKLDALLSIHNYQDMNPHGYDREVKEKINTLYNLFDMIKPLGDDEYKVIYFSAQKGSIKDYGDYQDLKATGVVKNYKEFRNMFNEDYPDKEYWYEMVSSRYKNYRTISINSELVINADMDKEGWTFQNGQLQELLDFLIVKVKDVIERLKDGTYNEYIKENYSYKNKFGVIKRKDYWDLFPELKTDLLGAISQEEIDYFIDNASDTIENRIKEMTSSKYFECVAMAYKDIGYEIGNLSSKELYLKYADGRDEGLSEIKEDSSEEFAKWYSDRTRTGGHPWEIIRGHSFARVNLQVVKDEVGYYLTIDGSKLLRKVQVARIFNILHKNNIPIRVYDAEVLKEAFKGEDDIGIVPFWVIPFMCGGYFEKYNPQEFTHMDDKKMLEYIKWEPLKKVELKKKYNKKGK